MELHRAIIYTTEMRKQGDEESCEDAVHSVPCELRCQADKSPKISKDLSRP
jgi:hypothetical protein